MSLHSGECEERGGDYFGPAVNRAARLEATAHGGQLVLSGVTAELVRDRLPADLTLRDMGEHHLKDLGRAERVYQVCGPGLAADFPPLRSLENPGLQHNLPEQASTFVGREREVAEVAALVDQTRLVTLAGPGGVGKTRLALQAAAELLDGSGDGVWFVDLAPVDDPSLVAAAVAKVLWVREQGDRPLLDTIVESVRDRRLLVVIDNCEQVIHEAAVVVEALVRRCPGVYVLSTSRETLGIAGEHVYRVEPLGIPRADDPETVAASEAVGLFVERARHHKADFAVDADNAAVRGPAVPAAGRHPLRHRAGRRPHALDVGPRPRRPPRQAIPAAHRRVPDGRPPPADPPGAHRLVLQPAGPGRADRPRPAVECSPAASTSPRPRRCAPAATSTSSMSSTSSTRWWPRA